MGDVNLFQKTTSQRVTEEAIVNRYYQLSAIWTLVLLVLSVPVHSHAQVQSKLQPDGVEPGTWLGWSVALDGDLAVVGAPLTDTGGRANVGAAHVYRYEGPGQWAHVQQLAIPDPVLGDQLGYDVVIEGDRIVASSGARDLQGEQSGAVYVFEPGSSGDWEVVAEIMPDDGEERDLFGHAMALQGDRLVVTAIGDDDGAPGAGAAYVFERDVNGIWLQTAKLKVQDPEESDRFGQDVAMDGGFIAVAASSRYGFFGSVVIFEKTPDGSWQQTAELMASDAGNTSYIMGVSIALDGDRLLAGAPDNDPPNYRAGSAYIFERDETGTWGEVARLEASDLKEQVGFGYGVDLDGDWAIIGTNIDSRTDAPEGCVYLFNRRDDGTWHEVNRLMAYDNTGYVDQFGWSVDIQGDRAVIGSFLTGGSGQGAMYTLEQISASATATDGPTELPMQVMLHGNYPNPFNPSTIIRFDVPSSAHVSLTVFDLLGRQVKSMVNRQVPAGVHEVSFDAAGLPSGIYFITLRSGGVVQTRTMSLVR